MALTKVKREVLALSAGLPPMSADERKEALRYYAVIYAGKKSAWCSRCGRSWESSLWDNKRKKKDECPHCGTVGYVKRMARKEVHKDKYYFSLVRLVEGWQVIRTFFCDVYSRKECSVNPLAEICREVCQIWFRPGTSPIFLGRKVKGSCGGPCDLWRWDSEIGLKYDHYRFRLSSAWDGRTELHPIIKRNGFSRLRSGFEVVGQIDHMMNDHRIEVLAKGKQWPLVEYYLRDGYKVRKYWDQIRICMRHKYVIKDPSLWMDMVDMLRELHKDTHNPHYICPGNDRLSVLGKERRKRQEALKKAHDETMRRLEHQRRLRAEAAKEERRKKLELAAQDYTRRLGRLLDIVVVRGSISLTPLQNIEDFKIEGDTLQHCVFVNHYYDKEDTLILSARVDGERTETIELNLKSGNIMQCRGKHNQNSAYHAEILALMKDNVHKYCKAI